MKRTTLFLIISLGIALACQASYSVYNKVNDALHPQITVIGRFDYSGTFAGFPTSGTYYLTNTIVTNTFASFQDPEELAYIDPGSGTWHAWFQNVNGIQYSYARTDTNTHDFATDNTNVVEEVLYGASWDWPFIPAAASRVDFLTITGPNQAGNTLASSTACGPCQGTETHPMAQYKFHTLLTSLSIYDTPISYSVPKGPAVAFRVTYNQKEAFQDTNWTYSNLGPKWNLSAIAYIQDNTQNVTNDVRCFPQGGGSEVFSGFDANSQTFATGIYSQSKLTRTSATSYVRSFTDGSSEVYDYPDSETTNRRVFLTKTLDASSNQVSYIYQTTTNGIILQYVVDAAGQTNTLNYTRSDDPLKVTSISDPFGRTAYFSYTPTIDALELYSITDPVQIVSSFSYTSGDFINALTTPYGTTTFNYTEQAGNYVLTATDPYGETECLQYQVDAAVPIDSVYPSGMLLDVNMLGSRNSYYWNKKAWAQGSNDVSYADITHWAVQNGEVADIPLYTKRPLEGTVWYNYPGQTDVAGTGITSAQPSIIARVLDDGTTQKATLAYDGWGNLTNSVDAAGRTTRYIYSTNGIDLLQVQQKNGSTNDVLATFSYNSQHLPIVAMVAGVTNWFGYNAAGQLLTSTNALNQITTYNYNQLGLITNIVGHLPTDVLNLTYDNAGRIYSLTDSQGYSITNTYDTIDRITNSALPDGTTIQTVYDKLNVGRIKGRDNRWTYYSSDAERRLSTIQDTAGRLFHYDWCGCGALDAITDPKGQMTAWIRDTQSRPTQKLYADLQGDSTAYESRSSRVKQTTDAAGKTTALKYSSDNNITNISYSGGPITPGVRFTFDTNYNRVTRMVDGIGTNLLSYVPAGQPGAGSVQSIDGPLPNDTIAFGYDALGRPLTVQIGSATSAVQYDDLGRIYWSSNQLGITTVAYVDATSRPSQVSRPDGLTTVFTYTPVSDGSRLQTMTTTNTAGQVVQSYGYGYDVRNLILWETNVIPGVTSVWNFSYDLAQELTAATQWTNGMVAHRYSYVYDKAGNRLSEQIDETASTETPNNLNQLANRAGGGVVRVAGYINKTGSVSIVGAPARMTTPTNFEGEILVDPGTYTIPVTATDLNTNTSTTNIVRTFTANGMDTSLTYDLAGNLVSKATTNQTLTFGWDGADRCTAITNGANRTIISYDGMNRWSRIQEYTGTTLTADRRFVWNGTTLAEERDATGTNVVKRFFANGFWQQGTNYYYLTDHLGSVVAVTIGNGTVVARFDYNPYGRRTQEFGTLQVDYGFAGLVEHAASGLKLAVWRIYDPSMGRWLSRDPIREEGGWNVYSYCINNPIGCSDCLGLQVDYSNLSATDGLNDFAQKYVNPNFVTVVIHGEEKSWPEHSFVKNSVIDAHAPKAAWWEKDQQLKNGDWLAQQLQPALKAKPGKPILLVTCGAGYGAAQSTAASIARNTGRNVIATDTWASAWNDTDARRAKNLSVDPFPKDGRPWLMFTPDGRIYSIKGLNAPTPVQ